MFAFLNEVDVTSFSELFEWKVEVVTIAAGRFKEAVVNLPGAEIKSIPTKKVDDCEYFDVEYV